MGITYRNDLQADAVRRLLSYNPETGEFTKLAPGASVSRVPNSTGYLRIAIGGRSYKAHRVAWLLAHGEWPSEHLDHVNGVKTDNRLSNLRPATHRQNKQNIGRQRNNSSGFKGVYLHTLSKPENPRWVARIKAGKKYRHLGCFSTAEEAAEAYRRAAEKLHGEFANFDDHGNPFLHKAKLKKPERRKRSKGTIYSVKDGTAWVAQYKRQYVGFYRSREMAELALAQHIAEADSTPSTG